MKIETVDQAHTNVIWSMVEGFIEEALSHSGGDYSVDEARTLVNMGHWVLMVAVEDQRVVGACTVSFFNRPSARVAFITAIGGRLISSPDTFKQLSTLCKSFGATQIEGAARESIARLWKRYGFEEKYRIVGVKI